MDVMRPSRTLGSADSKESATDRKHVNSNKGLANTGANSRRRKFRKGSKIVVDEMQQFTEEFLRFGNAQVARKNNEQAREQQHRQ